MINHINQNIENIKLTDIDRQNNQFLTSTFFDLEELKNSIQTHGIQSPVKLIRKNNSSAKFQIISGFKRIHIAMLLKNDDIPAIIIKNKNNLKDLFDQQLSENLSIRSFNLIEKYYAIKCLKQFKTSNQEILTKYLPLLNLKEHLNNLDKKLSVLNLNDKILEKISLDQISNDTTLYLLELNKKEQLTLTSFIEKFGLAKNKQRQLITLIKDIIRIQNKELAVLLNELEVHAVNDKATKNQCSNKLFKNLHSMRYPLLNGYETGFASILKELKLSKIKLEHSHNFETDSYDVHFKFKNLKDIEKAQKELIKISNKIQALVELTKK